MIFILLVAFQTSWETLASKITKVPLRITKVSIYQITGLATTIIVWLVCKSLTSGCPKHWKDRLNLRKAILSLSLFTTYYNLFCITHSIFHIETVCLYQWGLMISYHNTMIQLFFYTNKCKSWNKWIGKHSNSRI